jgi:hypothetical protein
MNFVLFKNLLQNFPNIVNEDLTRRLYNKRNALLHKNQELRPVLSRSMTENRCFFGIIMKIHLLVKLILMA